jgi:RNA polymerase sigma-70 factor, ECF subfamily
MSPAQPSSIHHAAESPRESADEQQQGKHDLAAVLLSLRQRLLRHARFAVHDQSAAEDLVQDTLIVLVEQQSQHRGESSLSTWAISILKHKVSDWYRSSARHRTVQWNSDEDALQMELDRQYASDGSYVNAVPNWQLPESRVERRQLMDVLERCVGALPTQTGRVFMMREWLGFENGEICERLGISSDHCRTILHRARMALRICIQRH